MIFIPCPRQQPMEMKGTFTLLITSLLLCTLISGVSPAPTSRLHSIKGTVLLNEHLTDYADLSSCRVALNGGTFVAYFRQNGKFLFQNVPSGVYLLEILSTKYRFPKLQLDVDRDGDVKVLPFTPGVEWDAELPPLPYPLKLTATAKPEYFVQREGFNMMGMLMNPMMLMTLFTVGIMFILPKLTEGLDPEDMRQFQQSQAAMQNSLSNTPDVAQFLAGLSSSGASSSSSEPRSQRGRKS